jgi:hypothetical protein
LGKGEGEGGSGVGVRRRNNGVQRDEKKAEKNVYIL